MVVSGVMTRPSGADRSKMSRWTAGLPLLLLVTVLASACASTGAVPRPFPMPGGSTSAPPQTQPQPSPTPDTTPPTMPGSPLPAPPALAPTSSVDVYGLTGTALALRGTPYRNGGGDPQDGFDCSGFTQYVFSRYGLILPREVRDQYRWGREVR